MKRNLLLFALLCCSSFAYAQNDFSTVEKQKEKLIRTAEDLKSGNYKDVLYSFFQIALRDFTGQNKALAFNTTLFALKAKANSELLKDVNFRNETFARNFQFNFRANLDEAFKYKGLTGGFTYAIINDRDKQTAVLGEAISKLYGEISDEINILVANGDATKLNPGLDTFVNTGELRDFPADFIEKNRAKLVVLSQKVQSVNKQTDAALKDLEKKSLWTVAFNGTHDKVSKLNSGSVNSVFLNGQKHEIDIRAALSYVDTVVTTKLSQIKFKSTAGFNFKFFAGPKNTFLEFKPHLEYNGVYENRLPDQKAHSFLANAELRLRVSEDIWVPFTMKYDIKDANFFGFLNVSFNLDAFK